jgi:hypothetical protein
LAEAQKLSDAALATPNFTTCGRCGLRSTLAAAFRPEQRARAPRVLCPGCTLDARVEEAAKARTPWLTGIGVVGAIAIAWLIPRGWLAANLFLWLPLAVVAMVCHELGHAVTARLLGLDVFKIVLGIGPVRFERRLLGFRWEVRKYLTGGVVWAAAGDVSRPLARMLAMTAAGPLTNLLLAAACVLVLANSGYVEDVLEGPTPLTGFALINLALAVGNLLPFKTASGMDSDGRGILVGLLKPAERLTKIRNAYYVVKFLDLRRLRCPREAMAVARAAVAADPENAHFLNLLGIACLDEGRYDEARSGFEAALARGSEAAMTAMLRNNLAYIALASGDLAGLARGAELSANAYDVLPWEPAVAGTRAGYLILEDRFAEAAAAIERTLGREMEPRDRKETLYTLALAYECSGDRARAAELRGAAERLAGVALRCVELVRAARLAGAPTR